MKATIKGTLEQILSTEKIEKSGDSKQYILLKEHGFVNEFGDKVGTDQFFKGSFLVKKDGSSKIDTKELKTLVGKKIEAVGYFNGFEFTKNESGTKDYGISLNIHSIKEFVRS